jgi:hypothetical protein
MRWILNDKSMGVLDRLAQIRMIARYQCSEYAGGGKLFHHIYQIACIDSDTDELATEGLQAIDKLID